MDTKGRPGAAANPPPPALAAVEERPARAYLARLAPSGRRVQATALAQIAAYLSEGRADVDTLPWAQLRYGHTHAVRSWLVTTYAPATANRMLAALRGVLTEAWRLGQMSAEDLHRTIDLDAARGERPPAGRHLSAAEIAAVLAACPDSPGGRRDAALLATLYGTAMRRSEAVALDLADVDLDARAVLIRAGKGAKHRRVFLPEGASTALRAWLRDRGDAAGAVFCPVRRGGHPVVSGRLTDRAVGYVLGRCAKAAGVDRFTAHDLRRTAVGDLLDAGADLATVAQICGHAHPGTTARYDRRPERARLRAAGLLHVPCPAPASGGGAALDQDRNPGAETG